MDSRSDDKKNEKNAAGDNSLTTLPRPILVSIAEYLSPIELAQFYQTCRLLEVMGGEGLRNVIRSSPDVFLARVAELEHHIRVPYMLSIQDLDKAIGLKELTASSPNNHALYACYALMTDDVKSLDANRLAQCVQYLESRKFPQNIIDSVEPLVVYKQQGVKELGEMLTDPDYKKTTSDKYVNLSGADLTDGKFDNADMRGFNMRHADLTRASMYGTNCRFANLSDATMLNVDARTASFHEANLSGAKLGGANLQGSYINDAKTTGAIFDNKTLLVPEELDDNKLKAVLQLCQHLKIQPDNILGQFLDNVRSNVELRGIGNSVKLLQTAHDNPYFGAGAVNHASFFGQNETGARASIRMEMTSIKEQVYSQTRSNK